MLREQGLAEAGEEAHKNFNIVTFASHTDVFVDGKLRMPAQLESQASVLDKVLLSGSIRVSDTSSKGLSCRSDRELILSFVSDLLNFYSSGHKFVHRSGSELKPTQLAAYALAIARYIVKNRPTPSSRFTDAASEKEFQKKLYEQEMQLLRQAYLACDRMTQRN